jgi:P-type E1-E2 ATPase
MAKAEAVRSLREAGRKSLFVGDGLNDAPAMAAAHVSVAVESGSTLTAESADILWTNRDLTAIPEALSVCRQTVSLLRSNLRFALSYNLIGMAVAAAGWLHPVVAAILMLFSSLFVTLRGARLGEHQEKDVDQATSSTSPPFVPACC